MAFLSIVSSDLDKHIFCMLGLSPDDSFDEAVADMITDGVTDIKDAVIKAHFEKDEAKKVLTVFCQVYTNRINLKWDVFELVITHKRLDNNLVIVAVAQGHEAFELCILLYFHFGPKNDIWSFSICQSKQDM